MRLLHVAERLSCRGGADWHLLGVLGALAEEHEVLLVVGRDDGTATAPCRVIRGPSGSSPQELAALDALVENFAPDHIHLHNIMDSGLLLWAVDKQAFVTIQDHRFFCPGRGKETLDGEVCREPMQRTRCVRCLQDQAYGERLCNLTEARLAAVRQLRVTVLSNYMRWELVAVGVPPERVRVIPPFVHGLDPAVAPAEGPPCVLFVGRLVASKGVHEALTAWQRSGVTLPLVFVGTGSQRGALERAGCEVTGWVSHAQLGALYRRGRVVVMPPRWQEPFGIVGLEALRMGTPVVAWHSGGICDWHGPTGLLSRGDVNGLAEAIRDRSGSTAVPAAGRFERRELTERLVRFYRLGSTERACS